MFSRNENPVLLLSDSPETTKKYGRRFGELLRNGDVVYLYGEIGAGKTVFTSGLAESLGVTDYVTSPTFTIANEYHGSLLLYHFDAYRIESPDELSETGFYDFAGGECVVVVEWAEKLRGAGPCDRIEVWIDSFDAADGLRDDMYRAIKIKFPR